jgi:rhodanese-related sulfurtransferase
MSIKKVLLGLLTLAVTVGLSVGTTLYVLSRPELLTRHFYAGEMAAVVSPATLKKYIDEKATNYVLVDLRSQGEYEKEHFKTAVNIPAGSMSEAQLVAMFAKLPKDKEIIVHCYSAYCTLGRQVGQALSRHGIYVKELTVGWSELRYHWDLWNPGAGVDDGQDYIVTGKADPSNAPIIPCTVGEFGC